jgi:hypothetical protein
MVPITPFEVFLVSVLFLFFGMSCFLSESFLTQKENKIAGHVAHINECVCLLQVSVFLYYPLFLCSLYTGNDANA